MLLAIDVGNTNTKFALYEGDELVASWRISTSSRRTGDEYAAWLTQMMQLGGIAANAITGAAISCVVPEAEALLIALCQKHFNVRPVVVGQPETRLPIKALIDHPGEAGADRLVNAVAAHDRFGGPLILIDFGTATTFDLIDASGNYCGGAIAPGVNISLHALYNAAAKLPHVSIAKPSRVIATATVPAMQSGLFWGYVGLVEGLVERMRTEHGSDLPVYATGGLAALFADATSDLIKTTANDLTLWGLVLIHRFNQQK